MTDPPSAASTVTSAAARAGSASAKGTLALVWLFPRPSDPAVNLELAPGAELVIGRDESAALRVSDLNVSRRHAVLRGEASAVYVSDQGSRSGTFINGRSVKAAALAGGDVVRVGDSVALVTDRPGAVREMAPGLFADPAEPHPRSGLCRACLLFVFVVLAHDRRRILGINVTSSPSAAWTANQIVQTFPWATAPRYLLRDRDGSYGSFFRRRVRDLGIEEREVQKVLTDSRAGAHETARCASSTAGGRGASHRRVLRLSSRRNSFLRPTRVAEARDAARGPSTARVYPSVPRCRRTRAFRCCVLLRSRLRRVLA
jgi:hypothetical protein